MSLRVKKIKIGEYLAKLHGKNVIVSCTCALGQHTAKNGESARNNHVLACNFADY